MQGRLPDISGFVLAGGASRRMGRPKALLHFEGEALVERQARLLSRVCCRVAAIGPQEILEGLHVPVVPDRVSDCGPLAGIWSGLEASPTEYNLVIGCDMPFLTARFLGWLSRRGVAGGADVTVPEAQDGEMNPLAAMYRRNALGAIREALDKGEYSIRRFFPRVRCVMVPWPELARAGFSPRIFDNLNTPADYEAAQKKLSVVRGQ